MSDYYASPNGGGDGLEIENPFQIEDLWSVAEPGDILNLLDGTYTGSMSMINPKVGGIANSPIVIRALNDGKAIIDGEYNIRPVTINNNHIILEGFRAQNSNLGVITIYGSHIVLRRVSAYNADYSGNRSIIGVGAPASYVLFEDCAASGTGRDCFRVHNSHHVTLRRCWARWIGTGWPGPHFGQIYASDNCIIENCVGTMDINSPSPYKDDILGLSNWCASWSPQPANHNKYIGCVFYDFIVATFTDTSEPASDSFQITDTYYSDCVSIGAMNGMLTWHDDNLRMNKMTMVDNSYNGIAMKKKGPFITKGDLRNSVLLNGGTGIYVEGGTNLIHAYNNIYGFTTPYSGTSKGFGEMSINPNFNTAKYGKGAYLLVPIAMKGKGEGGEDLGAEVLYQYENGVLTDKRLWPWPMEERIFNETGVSVTFESHGGLWKTLDGAYEPELTGTIAGIVIDKDTGLPISGVKVTADGYEDMTE